MFLAFDGPTPMLIRVTPWPSRRIEVVGRHLEAVPGRRRDLGGDGRLVEAALDDDAAGQDEALEGPVLGELADRPAHELVDVAVVVGEQDPGLDRRQSVPV